MKLTHKFVANEIGGHFIAVPVGEGQSPFNGFVKLNETARYIFDQLNEEISKEELTGRVVGKFGCTKDLAEENVDYIIDGLRKANLLAE